MIRTAQPKRLVLLRHAETVKNRQGKHGGGDETLTERGLVQLKVAAAQLSRLAGASRYALFSQPDIRCVSSATMLGPRLSVYPRVVNELRGIDMGVVAGLSDRQLALRHPLVTLSYLQWRAGSSLHRPHIKNAESITDFANRSAHGLQTLLETTDADTIIFVGTTSGLLMLNHLLVHDGQFDRHDYRFYELGFDELASWQLGPAQSPRLIPSI